MKKIFLGIICLLLVGCGTPKVDRTLEKLGYTSEQITVIKEYEGCINKASTEYNENIYLLMKTPGFTCDNLDDYLDYLTEYNISLEDVIMIVNNGITNYYNKELINIINGDYYINDNMERYVSYLKENETFTAKQIITNVNSKIDNDFYTNTTATDMSKEDLIIVNKYYYLSKDYVPKDLRLIKESCRVGSKGSLVDSVATAFEELCDAALLNNMVIKNRSAYRSYDTQKDLYNSYSAKDGKKQADTYSARAGYSEHQTGLALDLTVTKDSEEYKWMKENAYKYGFIIRYPKDKEYITGYQFEPWHYRYVGKEIAKYIYDNDLTYEEYYEFYVKYDNEMEKNNIVVED